MLHFSRVQPPEPHTVTLEVDQELTAKIDAWRAAQADQTLSPSDAIQKLLHRALQAEGFMAATPTGFSKSAQVEDMVRAFQSAITGLRT